MEDIDDLLTEVKNKLTVCKNQQELIDNIKDVLNKDEKEKEKEVVSENPIVVNCEEILPEPEPNRIPEISPEKFESFLAEIREAIGKESKEETDPFLEAIIKKYPRACDYKNQISQKIGIFHQKTMGEFSEWESFESGKGVDVFSKDGKTVIEVKNKYNTMNSDSQKSVMEKLQKFVSGGKTAILCIINVKNNKPPKFPKAGDVQIKSGKEMYKILSGRETFLDDLLATFSKKI